MMSSEVRAPTWMLLIVHAVKDEVIVSKFLGAISTSIERLAERTQRVPDDRPVLRSGHARDIITWISTSP
jgi:lysozyme family protein